MHALLALVVWAAQASPSAATPRLKDSLAIVPMVTEGPHGSIRVDGLYRAVLNATKSRMGLRVLSWEEVYVAREGGLENRVRSCGSNSACVASKLRSLDARMGLVVQLIFDLEPPVYRLQLLDTDAQLEVEKSVGRLPPNQDATAYIAAEADRLLARAGYIQSGRLVVDVEPPAAVIQIEEGAVADMGTPNIFTLRPGLYHVDASLEGYLPAKAEATVQPAEITTVQLQLEEDTSIWTNPWFLSGAALVVAGAAVGIVAAAVYERETIIRTCQRGTPGCDSNN